MDYKNIFKTKIEEIKKSNNYRKFNNLEKICGNFPSSKLYDNDSIKNITVWCSNDYLGMGQNKDVINEVKRVLSLTGTGAGGTRNIAGSSIYHVNFEKNCANWYKKEASLLFTSGYIANLTTLSTLALKIPELIIYSDQLNHNSMIEGIKRGGSQKQIFKHNDLQDLERKIKSDKKNSPKLIALESVYSMNGSIAPIKEIISIAKKYNCLIYLDEVHAIGIYGEKGSGIAEKLGVLEHIDIIQGTLGKSIGQVGGFIASSKYVCDFVRSFGSGFIFTTSLPPSVVAGATKSIEIITSLNDKRKKIMNTSKYIKNELLKKKIPFIQNNTHIIPIMIGCSKKCTEISNILLNKYSLYLQPINYPTVEKGKEILRISVTSVHTKEHADFLINSLNKIFDKIKL